LAQPFQLEAACGSLEHRAASNVRYQPRSYKFACPQSTKPQHSQLDRN
jgi:hypothetical protein